MRCVQMIFLTKDLENYSKPAFSGFFTSNPLSFRTKLVNGFRKRSHSDKQKSYEIMDVNEQAVIAALENDALIHGHTHRPAIHEIQQNNRIVLGDWREDHAKILEIDPSSHMKQIKLTDWYY